MQKKIFETAEALGVEVEDLVKAIPGEAGGRVHLEEVLDNQHQVEIWYRSKELSHKELQFVQRLIDAALTKWEGEESTEA